MNEERKEQPEEDEPDNFPPLVPPQLRTSLEKMQSLSSRFREAVPKFDPLFDSETEARLNAFMAEKEAAPLVMRDALIALRDEAEARQRRERWTLVLVAATFLVSLAALLAGLF